MLYVSRKGKYYSSEKYHQVKAEDAFQVLLLHAACDSWRGVSCSGFIKFVDVIYTLIPFREIPQLCGPFFNGKSFTFPSGSGIAITVMAGKKNYRDKLEFLLLRGRSPRGSIFESLSRSVKFFQPLRHFGVLVYCLLYLLTCIGF